MIDKAKHLRPHATCIHGLCESPLCGLPHGRCNDVDAVLQVKQEVGELSQAGRRDKRQVQKLQLELLQAKQLLEKLRSNKPVIPISTKAA